MRDFKRMQNDPPEGVNGAPQDNDIMKWHAVIFGCDPHFAHLPAPPSRPISPTPLRHRRGVWAPCPRPPAPRWRPGPTTPLGRTGPSSLASSSLKSTRTKHRPSVRRADARVHVAACHGPLLTPAPCRVAEFLTKMFHPNSARLLAPPCLTFTHTLSLTLNLTLTPWHARGMPVPIAVPCPCSCRAVPRAVPVPAALAIGHTTPPTLLRSYLCLPAPPPFSLRRRVDLPGHPAEPMVAHL